MENVINKNFTFGTGRMAALSIAVETIVFAVSLVWELITPLDFARNIGYIASLLHPSSAEYSDHRGVRQMRWEIMCFYFGVSFLYPSRCCSCDISIQNKG